MANIMVCLMVSLLLALSIAVCAMACVFCSRWHKAYLKLKNKHEMLKKENIKLQHDVYRMTYITPDVDTKKGRNGNGTK